MMIRYRDLAARIFDDEIRFPAFLPNSQRDEGAQGVLVNVYRIWTDRNYRRIIRRTVSEYVGGKTFVLPESGWQQIDRYDDDVSNEEIIETQAKMDFPVIAPLAAARMRDAFANAEIAREMTNKLLFLEVNPAWSEDEIAAFVDATKEMAWGYGIKSESVDKITAILKSAPRSKKLHVFGIHHPAIIPSLVALGVDSVSTGAHARYAEKGLYITEASIVPLNKLAELPCNCDACEGRAPGDLDYDTLKRHNLKAFLLEMKRTRNAIKEGRLYEYARRRAMTHPRIMKLFEAVVSTEWVLENQPFPKQNSIYNFGDAKKRPEWVIGTSLAKERGVRIEDLAYTFPFGQTYPEEIHSRPGPEEFVRAVLMYQWGLELEGVEWKIRHGIPRDLFYKGQRIGLIRYEDGMFVPNIFGAKIIAEKTKSPHNRIVLDETGVSRLKNGRTPLAENAVDWDPRLRPNQEIIIVDMSGNVVATGRSILTAREMAEISGPAVKIRHRAV